VNILRDFSSSVDKALDAANNLVRSVKNDPQLLQLYRETKQMAWQLVREPDRYLYESRDEIRNQFHRVRDVFRYERRDIYEQFRQVLDYFRTVFDDIRNDTDVQRVAVDAKRLAQDLTHAGGPDSQHELDWELVGELKTLLLPLVLRNIQTFTINRIEGSRGNYDFWLKDISVVAESLLPENIHMEWRNDLDLALRRTAADRAVSTLRVQIHKFTAKIEGIHFWFRHRTTPKWEDEGVMDVIMDRDGMDFEIIFQSYNESSRLKGEGRDFVGVRSVDCDVNRLSFRFRDSKHDTLYRVYTTLFRPMIKSRFETLIEEKLKSQIESSYDQISSAWCTMKEQSKKLLQATGITTGNSDKGGFASTIKDIAGGAISNVFDTKQNQQDSSKSDNTSSGSTPFDVHPTFGGGRSLEQQYPGFKAGEQQAPTEGSRSAQNPHPTVSSWAIPAGSASNKPYEATGTPSPTMAGRAHELRTAGSSSQPITAPATAMHADPLLSPVDTTISNTSDEQHQVEGNKFNTNVHSYKTTGPF